MLGTGFRETVIISLGIDKELRQYVFDIDRYLSV